METCVKLYTKKQDIYIVEAVLITVSILKKRKKKGEWIEHERTDLGEVLNHCIECSNCHIWFSKDKLIRNSYCPNCGAIMNTNLLRVSRQQD